LNRFLRFTLLCLLFAGLYFFFFKTQIGASWVESLSRPSLWIAAKTDLKKSLSEENQSLKKELARIKKESLTLNEIKKENQRLKKLLELRQNISYEAMAASVIGRDPTSWFRTLFINKGSDHGVQENMPVIHDQGLVGHIIKVLPTFAKVQLIVDVNSRVGALAQRTREMGILKGGGQNGCLLDYLPRETLIKKGDKVVSSGMGSLYPKGIPVGQVEEIRFKKRGLYQTAKIKPLVNFNTLEEVLILKIE